MIRHKDTKFTKLFVGGIPYESDDEALRSFFSQFGDIEEAVVIKDRTTKKSKGYGFVTMATPDAAEQACKNKRPMIEGRQANVNLAYLGAKPKPAKILKSPPESPYSYQTSFAVGSPQQFFAPLYTPQPGSPQCNSPIPTVLPPGPQSPGPVVPPLQPIYMDYGGGTVVVLNAVYDPYFYSAAPHQATGSYIQALPHSPPVTSSPSTQAFTFPVATAVPAPLTPTVTGMNAMNTQHFFPAAPYEILAQP